MASMQLDHSGSDGSSPHSGEFDDCGSSSSGDQSSPSDSAYASPAGLGSVWSNELGFMIQPWSTGQDSLFDLGHTSPQPSQVSPGMVIKPLTGLDRAHQTHDQDPASLATDFWNQPADYNPAFGHDSGAGGVISLDGIGPDGIYGPGSMDVEFDDMVHHHQCG